MTDRKPPRPGPFPPPLPGSLKGEPFPKAKSEPPPLDALHDTPPPDARRMRSTPPDGMPLPQRGREQSQSNPLEDIIKEQRAIIIHLRESLQTERVLPSPMPAAPRSRAHVAGKVGLNLGKYTTLVVGVLGLADVVVGLWFPEYVGPLGMLKRALGMP